MSRILFEKSVVDDFPPEEDYIVFELRDAGEECPPGLRSVQDLCRICEDRSNLSGRCNG
jgi:hypothetical protein